MYTCAFFAHMTLHPIAMSITLISVISNGLYTFCFYSYLVTKLLQKFTLRIFISFFTWICVIYVVMKLPYMLGPQVNIFNILAEMK